MNFYELFGVSSHKTFMVKIEDLLENREQRELTYDRLIEAGVDLTRDIFLDYFEAYNAEKKSNKQDFTPPEVARLLAQLSEPGKNEIYDGAAGTGSLLIAYWALTGDPIKIRATERSDEALPFLLHNLAIRNLEAYITHGDTLTGEIFDEYRTVPGERYAEVVCET